MLQIECQFTGTRSRNRQGKYILEITGGLILGGKDVVGGCYG